MIEFRDVTKTYPDGTHAVRRLQPRDPRAPDHGAGRLLGLGQDHPDAHDQPHGRSHLGHHRDRRRRTSRRSSPCSCAGASATSCRTPGLLPHRTVIDNIATVPRLTGVPKSGRPRAGARTDGYRRARPRSWPTATRASSRAGSSSGSASHAGWRSTPTSCSWTSRSAPSTRSCAPNCSKRCCGCRRELAKTIVFVSHDIDEAFLLGDQVVMLEKGGHIVQQGTPERDPRRTGERLRRDLHRRRPRQAAPARRADDRAATTACWWMPAATRWRHRRSGRSTVAATPARSRAASRTRRIRRATPDELGMDRSNLGLIGGRILEHLALTAPPIVIGFVLSIPSAGRVPVPARRARCCCGRRHALHDPVARARSRARSAGARPDVLEPTQPGRRAHDLRRRDHGRARPPTPSRRVDADVRQSATAVGFSRWQRFWVVEFPLAVPVLLAASGSSSVSTISLVTVGMLIGVDEPRVSSSPTASSAHPPRCSRDRARPWCSRWSSTSCSCSSVALAHAVDAQRPARATSRGAHVAAGRPPHEPLRRRLRVDPRPDASRPAAELSGHASASTSSTRGLRADRRRRSPFRSGTCIGHTGKGREIAVGISAPRVPCRPSGSSFC